MVDTGSSQYDDFAQLLAEHQSRLFGYVYAILPNMADAEDVYQDTVVTLWNKFAEYQPGTNFSLWARTVARFKIQHFFRSRARSRVLFDETLVAELSETQARIEDAVPRTFGDSYTVALLGCVKSLSEGDRRLIELCYDEQRSLTQIAAEYGRSPQSVWNSLNRIRRILFDCIRRAHSSEGG